MHRRCLKRKTACSANAPGKASSLSGLMQPIMQPHRQSRLCGHLRCWAADFAVSGRIYGRRHPVLHPPMRAASPSRFRRSRRCRTCSSRWPRLRNACSRMLDEEEEEQTAGVHASREVVRDGQTVTEPVRIEDVEASVTFDHVRFGYTEDKDHHQRLLGRHPQRQEDRHRRPHRRRQDDHGQAADALLRRQRRQHLHRTAIDVGVLRPQRAARACSAWCFRTPGCSPIRLWKTSATAVWTRPTRRS